jgi:hypothetical protein
MHIDDQFHSSDPGEARRDNGFGQTSAPLQFQHLTMPIRGKRDTNGLIARTQKSSGSQFSTMLTAKNAGWSLPDIPTPLPPVTEVRATTMVAPPLSQNGVADPYRVRQDSPQAVWGTDTREMMQAPPSLQRPVLETRLKPAYQNGYASQAMPFDVVVPGTPYPLHMAQVPNFAVAQAQQFNGAGAVQQGIWNQQHFLLESADAEAKKHSLLLELPHLIGYMIGMMAIFGLYIIIPLMILLNATLPASWNKLMIASGILVIGEIAICVILVKTIPSRKSKKKHTHSHTHQHQYQTHRRDALARS